MEHHKLMMMNRFLENPLPVLFLLILALNYSYFFVPNLPKGIPRILALAPVFYLLYFLPWCFSLAFLRGILSFFITWITSFKLILFCFNRGPLSICKNPIDFILISIFPLKIPTESRRKYEISDEKFAREAAGEPNSEGKNLREARRKYDGKSIRKASDELISREFRQEYEIAGKASDQPISVGKIPRNVSRKSVEKALDEPNSDRSTSIYERYEVEEISKQPYLATSFKDFWGRRWNHTHPKC